MKSFGMCKINFVVFCIVTFLFPLVVWAADIPQPETYFPTREQVEKYKKPFDDPRPYLKEFGPKQVLPKELYERLCYDEEKMKSLWTELIGFRAPDVVGKIAPEIKPGKYTYQDLGKYPGLKELMWPDLYNRIKPGGPPHAGNIPEFEIIPTRQYHWALPVAEATKENLGKTKLDNNGYIVPESWIAGYPFPQPSGPFKAQQVIYNLDKRYMAWDNNMGLTFRPIGLTKNLKIDFEGVYFIKAIRLAGRVTLGPYGWYDERAKHQGEKIAYMYNFLSPRDIAGTAFASLYYLDTGKADQLMVYVPSLRRVRKLTATDTQDPIQGQDIIYDDNDSFQQKLSPTRYPYKYEIIAEREYLVPAYTLDGSEYFSSKGFECRNMKFERRPIYVVQLTQSDPNYVYGKRIFIIDKETFLMHHMSNYDQKGRLYRTFDCNWSFFPEMGAFSYSGGMYLLRDHLDLHSGVQQFHQIPALWSRDDVGLEAVYKKGK